MTSFLTIVTGSTGDAGHAIAVRLSSDHDIIIMADLDIDTAIRAAAQLSDQFAPMQAAEHYAFWPKRLVFWPRLLPQQLQVLG